MRLVSHENSNGDAELLRLDRSEPNPRAVSRFFIRSFYLSRLISSLFQPVVAHLQIIVRQAVIVVKHVGSLGLDLAETALSDHDCTRG